jgi:hypothetical protein
MTDKQEKTVSKPVEGVTVITAASSAGLDSVPHQLGRLFVGSLAAYGADKVASKAYNTVVLAIRARRNK